MELYERIALSRKKAGLSQEQLGEKLGVSRQAVSKWESGQTNPDVAYVTEMCRLFGVSADWLLLGEEHADERPPAQCPRCGGIVTPMDNFCPACGFGLHSDVGCGYTLLLTPCEWIRPVDELKKLSRTGYFDEDSPLGRPINTLEAEALADEAPIILGRGLSPHEVDRILDSIAGTYESYFFFYPDEAGDTPEDLLRQTSLSHRQLKLTSHRKPLSFWGMVGAVVVGIVLTVLLLSLL